MPKTRDEIKAKKDPWFAFYHNDFMRGTLGLTDEETGVYIKIICVLYDHGGGVTGDIQWLSKASHTHPRALRRILQSLIKKGKITSEGGRISNARIVNEIQERRKRKEKRGESGKQTPLEPDSNGTKEPLECRSSGVSSELNPEKPNGINEGYHQKPPSPTSTATITDTDTEKTAASCCCNDELVWMKDVFGISEPEATEWLTEQIEIYGEGRVQAGVADYRRKFDSGGLQTHSIRTLRGFISAATPQTQQSAEPEHMRVYREMRAKQLAKQQAEQANA